jgi:hypothetical protein
MRYIAHMGDSGRSQLGNPEWRHFDSGNVSSAEARTEAVTHLPVHNPIKAARIRPTVLAIWLHNGP